MFYISVPLLIKLFLLFSLFWLFQIVWWFLLVLIVPFCLNPCCLFLLFMFISTTVFVSTLTTPIYWTVIVIIYSYCLFVLTAPFLDCCLFWLLFLNDPCPYYLSLFVVTVFVLIAKHLAKKAALPRKYNFVLKKHCCPP